MDILKYFGESPLDFEMTGVNYILIFTCSYVVSFNTSLYFFQGFIPAFVRLGPHTILTFIFFEQIRQNFGDDPKEN